MFIYLPAYALGYDFCLHTMPRCLMSTTRHALCMHTQLWPASWNQNLTPNHTDCWRGISASASLLVICRGCGREIYFRAPVFVHICTCNHTLHMICATHARQLDIYAKAIDTLTRRFSHFLLSCAKGHSEEEMHDWVRERLSELEAEKL